MKRLFIFTILLIHSLVTVNAQNSHYWYKGKNIPLICGNKHYVVVDDTTFMNYGYIRRLTPKYQIEQDSNNVRGIIDNDVIIKDIIYQTPSYISSKDSVEVFVSQNLYVKLKKESDYSLLATFANTYNVQIIGEAAIPMWYILRCGPESQHNAVEMANIFYESSLFSAAEPEFLTQIQNYCVDDTLFYYQWNLNNIGQNGDSVYIGLDINYCEAQKITQGNNSIIIAVFDQGVQFSHPDLNNIYPISFDAGAGTSPSWIFDDDPHGTACAGIIGASVNNKLGIAGISPYCPIMSISYRMREPIDINALAAGFRFAADNGCSVINNSWGGIISSTLLDDAISYALNYGRNGLGCVVTFAAGNNNKLIDYPSDSNEEIIVVGAISPCGERKSPTSCDNVEDWGSCVGKPLDVMAPGINIPTTDLVGEAGYSINEYAYFSGTSAACPHVSAIAGLILSVNPYLTQKEVSAIIESTARKIGPYNYTYQTGHPNGTWNKEMGYGLVDAYAAVSVAKEKYIQNQTYNSNQTIVEKAVNIYAGSNVTDTKPIGDVVVKSNSKVTFQATHQIQLHQGFRVERGATFYAYISPIANNNLSPIITARHNVKKEIATTSNTQIETLNISKSICIFPNPTKENISVISSEPIKMIYIYNLNGECINQGAETEINVSSFPSGMYLLYAITADAATHTQKFIKQ